jgi:hypothetical protein
MIKDLQDALGALNPKASCGPDGIRMDLLASIVSDAHSGQSLVDLFNSFLLQGYQSLFNKTNAI